MKKAIVYIDGYNLYFGLLKGTPWKWLDLRRFAEALVAGRFEIIEVRYFTAPIKTHPVDLAATERQNAYVQALLTLLGVKVVQGIYSNSESLRITRTFREICPPAASFPMRSQSACTGMSSVALKCGSNYAARLLRRRKARRV